MDKMGSKTFGLLIVCQLLRLCSTQICDPQWSSTHIETPSQIVHRKNYRNVEDRRSDLCNSATLRLVHVLFRHGDRTPDSDTLYPKDPYANYTFYPVGYGQLTNLGKKQEYGIGRTLRERYNEFLADIYTPEVLDARSTDVNRTKASLELALAGLFPPVKEQMWNADLPWQPIPYNYWLANEDQLLGDPNVACPYYNKIYGRNLRSEENVNYNANLKNFYEYLNYHTGLNMSTVEEVYNIYFTFKAEEAWGLKLPEWTNCIWPNKFLEVAIKQYEIFTQTPELTSFAAGILLEKIINDSEEVMNKRQTTQGRKIFLYSAHERDVALVLIGLGIFYPHIPPYGSYVIIEFHEISGAYGFKVFYQDYVEQNPRLVAIPGCDNFCPIDKFYKLLEHNLPKRSCNNS